jgi:Zn-dependent membrane protease YugP
MLFDVEPLYFVVLAPGLALVLWAQWRTHRAFRQGKRSAAACGITGAQAAAEVLQAAGATGVAIESVADFLTDHHDPHNKVLRLSPEVYYGQSLAALGVAAHEAGHALQDATHYPLLGLRTWLVRIASIGSLLFWLLFLAGCTLLAVRPNWGAPVLLLGIATCLLTIVCQLVALPVECDASKRVQRLLVHSGTVTAVEDSVMQQVRHAAAVTHMAAILTTARRPLCYFMRVGLLGRSGPEVCKASQAK